jgi:hypothetical protein
VDRLTVLRVLQKELPGPKPAIDLAELLVGIFPTIPNKRKVDQRKSMEELFVARHLLFENVVFATPRVPFLLNLAYDHATVMGSVQP